MRLHSGERPYCCNECNATFVQSSHLNIHKRTHTGEKPYQCDVCKQTFKQISHLKTHERIHTQTKPFSCKYCGNAFIQKSSLNRHMKIHTGERPYSCTICHATFCVKNNLNRHMAIHLGTQPFECKLCGAAFGQSIDLKRHKISHTGIKPYRCEECQATFSRNNNLKWHKYTHTGETPFKCDQCSCRFMKPRDLKKHKLTHNPPKHHTCSICQEEFHQPNLLKKHMMIAHTSEKPFTCDECSATFATRNTLKRHMQKHSEPKTFKCKDCNAEFNEFKSMKDHSLQNHDDKNEQPDQAKLNETLQSDIKVQPIDLQSNNILLDSNSIIPSQFMTYQLQVQDPNIHSTLQCTPYNNAQDTQQAPMTYTAPAVGLPSFQPFVQTSVSTLMISTGPGQPVRAARPANNCQNHFAHIITMTSNNQLQSWCFCNVPTIPSGTVQSASSSSLSDGSLGLHLTHQQADIHLLPPQGDQQHHEHLVKIEDQNILSNVISEQVNESQFLSVRSFGGNQSIVDTKATSPLQVHIYTEGQDAPTQPVWINGS